jgi:uncharacterized membrane protein YgdD (TMEM256/DUF423 family)
MNDTYNCSMNFLRFSMISMAVAVALGALGAHALKANLTPESLLSWQTAVQYQIYHSLAIMVISLAGMKEIVKAQTIKLPLWLMTAGIVFFSGSIYFLSTRTISGLSVSWLGPITPLGGVCFIGAWVLLAFGIRGKSFND